MMISLLIKGLYRKILKKFFPKYFYPKCVFHPSCSEYAITAFQKYNFFQALTKTRIRLKKCDGRYISYGTIDNP